MLMISVIASLSGLFGMLGLWALAWWLWKRALATPPSVASQPSRRPTWQNEPTPDRALPKPPPSWVFEGGPEAAQPDADAVPVPVASRRPSSSAHTSFFSREDLDQAQSQTQSQTQSHDDKTEILADDEMFDVGEAVPPPTPRASRRADTVGNSRKTWLFPGMRSGKDQ